MEAEEILDLAKKALEAKNYSLLAHLSHVTCSLKTEKDREKVYSFFRHLPFSIQDKISIL